MISSALHARDAHNPRRGALTHLRFALERRDSSGADPAWARKRGSLLVGPRSSQIHSMVSRVHLDVYRAARDLRRRLLPGYALGRAQDTNRQAIYNRRGIGFRGGV